jgi:uncharacterized protein (TIGR03435 family)
VVDHWDRSSENEIGWWNIVRATERGRSRRQAAVFCGFLCMAIACAGLGQTAASTAAEGAAYVPNLTFDVASIRENKAVWPYETGSDNPEHASKFTAKNLRAKFLVEWAYRLEAQQIIGGPDWFNRATFWIEAKSDAAAEEKLVKLNDEQAHLEKLHMIQALLEERFHLTAHMETRVSPIYALVVARSGPKLSAAGSLQPDAEELTRYGAGKIPPLSQELKGRVGMEFYGHGCSMSRLALVLSGQMGRNVVDQTGLTGTYDFTLRYYGAEPTEVNQDPTIWPALMDAVPDQLGLKLESTNGPMQVLVIDHIEKPSEN